MKYKNLFYGKTIAVTGKLENYTRTSIQSRLLELGAYPTSTVSQKTDYLLVGVKSGAASWIRQKPWASLSYLSRNLKRWLAERRLWHGND